MILTLIERVADIYVIIIVVFEIEDEQKALKQKGAASTWGIDTDVYREVGFEGFRFFRVIQVGKNSSGSDNLALSGFELYGKVTSGRWP